MAVERFDIRLDIFAHWFTREDLGMAKLAPNKVGWNRATAVDVVGYRLRFKEAPGTIDYSDAPIELGNVDQVDFSSRAEFVGIDGTYNLGITAVDDGDNESDISRLDSFPLDLVAPDAPTNVRRL